MHRTLKSKATASANAVDTETWPPFELLLGLWQLWNVLLVQSQMQLLAPL